ncbi:TetR/AcrR family transcriptional regulator [Vibrio campbellii]|uniref:TetR/AcrR family transcriptional regulator n=1 Tax=Vibrio campbellii TaxID=680 RepID=UPI0003AAFA87|nr:TetR/AcrR family transcriptional regulator [Vibrio campbellii]
MKELSPTAAKIADLAESYIQSRGFNGFSFRDIQNELGIKTASIHYHFKTKQDLAEAVFERYLANYETALIQIESQPSSAEEKIEALADIFIGVREQDKLCLCGMYASDFYSLADSLEGLLSRFVQTNEQWLQKIIDQGAENGEFDLRVESAQVARLIFVALEGSMLLSQFKDADYIRSVKASCLALLKR